MTTPFVYNKNAKTPIILKFEQILIYGSTKGQPSWMIDMVFCIHIIHCLGVLIILSYLLVLKLQRWLVILLLQVTQAGRPLEDKCPHGQSWQSWVTSHTIPINLSHKIPSGLCIVHHEPLQNYSWHTILCHNAFKFSLSKVWTSLSSYCMSQHAILSTNLQYSLSYT